MGKPFIYEFLYRGGETPAADDDTWQVQLAQYVDNPVTGSRTLVVGPVMGPHEAAAAGYSLSDVVKGLNALAVEDVSRLRRERNKALDEKEALEAAQRK